MDEIIKSEDFQELPKSSVELAKKKMGRPTKYDPIVADGILFLIATTTWGIQRICKELGLNYSTVWYWLDKNYYEFSDRYVRAKEQQQQLVADDIVDISEEEVEKNDMAAVQRNKLRVDTKKWLMGKLNIKTFGDKLQVDAPPPAKNLSEDQFELLIKKIAEKKKQDENGQYEDATIIPD